MTAICDAAIHLCRVRATRLDSLGNPEAGPNNVYVTDKSMMLQVRAEIEEGQDRTLVAGCDCIVALYKGFNKFKRWTFELDQGIIEPGLLELLIGADAVVDSSGDPIGLWWPEQTSCSDPAQPNVCLEAWQDLWDDDHQEASPHRYLHWIWPSAFFQIGDHTLQNDFTQPKVTGFSRANPNWGLGIFDDLPEAAGANGGFVYSDILPDAACGWQDQPLT